MQTYVAEISEILCAQRRDEEHLETLEKEFSKIVKDLVGVHLWIRSYKYLSILIRTAYYACTTLSGVQTLGEEYLSLLEVSDAKQRLIPSIWRRIIFVFLHIFVPHLAEQSLLRLQRLINHVDTRTFIGIQLVRNQKARRSFVEIVEWIRTKGLTSLSRLHLAIFYLFGTYYNISKRVAGIGYISFRPQTNIQTLWIFRFLAWLTFLQTSISVVGWICENFLSTALSEKRDITHCGEHSETFEDIDTEGSEIEISDRFRCPICLLSRCPSCLPCGHLYCWRCIIRHADNCTNFEHTTPRCPQCRNEFEANRVVPLLNF